MALMATALDGHETTCVTDIPASAKVWQVLQPSFLCSFFRVFLRTSYSLLIGLPWPRLAEVRAKADGPSEAKALLALAEVNADQRGSKKREEEGLFREARVVESRRGAGYL